MHGLCDGLGIGSGWATRLGDANVVVHSQSQSDGSCTTMAYGLGSLQRQARFTEAADDVEPGVVHRGTSRYRRCAQFGPGFIHWHHVEE